MARITVEDCLEKIDSQYDLVLLAKERASQLNAGEPPLVSLDNDKNTVVALREIGEGKVSIKTLPMDKLNSMNAYELCDKIIVKDVKDYSTDLTGGFTAVSFEDNYLLAA